MFLHRTLTTLLLAALSAGAANAETIRIAIGTQDTTINCATGGLLIRELKLLEKYLPRDGKYKDAQYEIVWKNFTSGAPLTNEMVAGKLDIGSMADFPGSFNGAAFEKAGKKSLFITVLSGSVQGSGNGIVVPKASAVQSLAELKGKTISVPFASTAHGMLLRAIKAQGWELDRDITVVTQAPEVAGSALQSNKIDAHADFVPFAELFPHRGYARKIFDGSQAKSPTLHGSLVDAAYAAKYPEIVTAFLRAAIEADRLIAAEPEKYSELIAKVTGIEAEVDYLFHGPLGLQTRDFSWKPEYRQAVKTSIETLRLMKRTDNDLDVNTFIDDRYIRAAFKQAGLDYDARLKNYNRLPLVAKDAATGKPITDFSRLTQIWVDGEPLVRHYTSADSAFTALRQLDKDGKKVRVVYAHDRDSGLKLFARDAWFVTVKGDTSAFLTRASADAWAARNGGSVVDFAAARGTTPALAAK
ncbi:ABC transporter substrate-binding protein [Oxalobacteraceae bacterium OTU3CAMAD1]|nr:ABC transporter substrate-binding protein [Oxalobacteraceae bacterium OTU3CAMAD1]